MQYRDHEKAAYVKSGYVQAARYQQAYVQVIAPDVQRQLQRLADKIAVANGVDMMFRVHIISDSSLGTYSMGSGDIFIPMVYLYMVANRDEIAFGLAREIATQHRLIHLREMEEEYKEYNRNQTISFVSSLVLSSAINAIFSQFVFLPIHKEIMGNLIDTKPASPYLSRELQQYVNFEKSLKNRQRSKDIGTILGALLGWAPHMLTNNSLKLVSHIIKISNEDADRSKRRRKNELGLTYMGVAGFDTSAGKAVINKIEEVHSDTKKDK